MAVVRKKQDDKFLKVLRELVTTGAGNRQCFDCGQKGPTYVNMTIGSFVCTRCSGVLRGLTPPHRVKSISMATFTQEEIDFLKAHGNDSCAKTWLGLWDPKRAVHQDHRELMIDKYERKRYYLEPASPLKSLTNAASLKGNNGNVGSSGGGGANANTSNGSASGSGNSNGNGNSNSSSNTNGTTSINNINNKNSNSATASLASHLQQQQHLTNGYPNHMSNGSANGNNSNNNKNTNSSAIVNNNNSSFQNITLTPPISQRTTQNGLHKSSSTAISRPQNGYHHLHHHQQQQQQHQQQHDAFVVNNVNKSGNGNGNLLNGFSSLHALNVSNGLGSGSGSASTGTLSDTSSNCTRNAFGTEADFIADFGSANIFDATTASSMASPINPTNGYAKVQQIKTAHFMNGGGIAGGGNGGGAGNLSAAAALMMNGNVRNQMNGTSDHSINSNGSNNTNNNNNNNSNNAENFADFDHAPIYNAAENYQFINKSNLHKSLKILQQQQQQNQMQQQCENENNLLNAKTTSIIENIAGNDFIDFINNNKNNNFFDFNRSYDPFFIDDETTKSKAIAMERGREKSWGGTKSLNNYFDDDDDYDNDFNFNNKNSIISKVMDENYSGIDKLKRHVALQQQQQQQPQPQQPPMEQSKFTPLAMAAHATAMAILDGRNEFNVSSSNNSWPYLDNPNTLTDSDINNFFESEANVNSKSNSGVDVDFVTNATAATDFENNFISPPAMSISNNGPIDYNGYGTSFSLTPTAIQGNPVTITTTTTMENTSTAASTMSPSSTRFSSTNPFISACAFSNSFNDSFNSTVDFYPTTHNHLRESSLDENQIQIQTQDYIDSWRLPMTNGYVTKQNGLTAAAAAAISNIMNNNNNYVKDGNKVLTPAEDRYAALKDLDEQLRESKAIASAAAATAATLTTNAICDTFGSNNNTNASINPFKQQQQQQQHITIANPFQASHQQQNHLFGQMSLLKNGSVSTNGFQQLTAAQQQQQQQQQQHNAFFNYNNHTATFPPVAVVPPSNGPNGCGFGFGSTQQQIAVAAGSNGSKTFSNPFAATGGILNSNNPFL